MAKATVQAALGPVLLRRINQKDHTEEEERFAQIILMVCILSIVLTAPVGAILISITGPKLLTKTKPLKPEGNKFALKRSESTNAFCTVLGWRRSHRPSLYDISVIDEREEREDPELQNDHHTIGNTNTHAHNMFLTVPK